MDLNPIRVGEATTSEESRYTSASDRIMGWQASRGRVARDTKGLPDGWLCALTLPDAPEADVGSAEAQPTPGRRASNKGLLPMSCEAYLTLVDWTGRQIRSDKRGAIPEDFAPILERLQIRSERWFDTVLQFDQRFGCVVGRVLAITAPASRMGRRWLHGRPAAAKSFV